VSSVLSAVSADERDEVEVNGTVYNRFVEALRREVPELLEAAMADLDALDVGEGVGDRKYGGNDRKDAQLGKVGGVGMWEGLKQGRGDEGGESGPPDGFAFAFEEDEEDMGEVPW
jgi:hypothetical protein